MAALKKYDPKEYIATWDGIVLNKGIVDGSFFTVSRNERNSSLNKGGDGGSTMVIGNDRSGNFGLTLRAGSDTNDELSDVVIKDESSDGTKRVGVLEIRDFSGRSHFIDEESYLDGPPDMEASNEEGENSWNFICPDLTIEARGSNFASESSGS